MGVGDGQLDAFEATAGQLAQELGPIGSASEVPTSMRSTSRRPVATNSPESRATGMLSIGQMEGINSTFCQADRIFLHRYDFNI